MALTIMQARCTPMGPAQEAISLLSQGQCQLKLLGTSQGVDGRSRKLPVQVHGINPQQRQLQETEIQEHPDQEQRITTYNLILHVTCGRGQHNEIDRSDHNSK